MKNNGGTIAALLVAALVAKGADLLRMKREPFRPDFPVHISGIYFADDSLQLLVVNLSSHPVEQVTVGVLLDGKTPRIGPPCDTSIPPGGFLRVDTANTGFEGADSWFRERGIAEKIAAVAITQVRFTNGMEWSYPLTAKGRFDGENDADVLKRIQSLRQKAFGPHDLSIILDPHPQGKLATCRKKEE